MSGRSLQGISHMIASTSKNHIKVGEIYYPIWVSIDVAERTNPIKILEFTEAHSFLITVVGMEYPPTLVSTFKYMLDLEAYHGSYLCLKEEYVEPAINFIRFKLMLASS